VIENVDQSRVPLRGAVRLCGTMFGLGTIWQGERRELRRHRLWEADSGWLTVPGPCRHQHRAVSVHGNPGGSSRRDGLSFPGVAGWREAMGMPWASVRELAEAIPPAYTEHVGGQLMAVVTGRVAA